MRTGQKQHRASPLTRMRASGAVVLGGMLMAGVIRAPEAQAETPTVLHRFTGGADGAYPEAPLFRDSAGNLYGTTSKGGIVNSICASGCGVVFKLDAAGEETVLYSFKGDPDGAGPSGALIRDSAGNFYGTTGYGGYGNGIVFKLDTSGVETVLYRFGDSFDGGFPYAGVISDSAGNLYGTAYRGGTSGDCSYAIPDGCGVVFQLDKSGTETVLHSFTGDGLGPESSLIRDSAGNFYGTTYFGYPSRLPCDTGLGCGTVFKLDTTGVYTVLYTFTGATDGALPSAGLIRDLAGNFYGTTGSGGIFNNTCSSGCGVVFKLDSTGAETVLHRFRGGADGAYPFAPLLQYSAGNLYGTTYRGGASGCGGIGCGIVFKLDAAGQETVLHRFRGGADGANPQAGLIRDSVGNLYGTTQYGGLVNSTCTSGCGVVFKLQP